MWREKKEGLDKIYKITDALIKKHKGDYEAATKEIKKWYKELPQTEPAKEHSHYSVIDENGIYFPADISWPGGGGPKYEVLHPTTKMPVLTPSRGWVYPSLQRMQEIIQQGKVSFGKDENSVPTLKYYLKEKEYQVPYSVIYQDGRAATKRLRDIFGYIPFANPKDENIISKLLKITTNGSGVVLDFFAGSGTTLHATMQLNAEDGGNRQCILITNNENNICEDVTYERNKRVIQGYTNAKEEPIAGLTNNNLRYYQTNFIPSEKTEKNRRKLTAACTELLQIKEDCYQSIKVKDLKAEQAKVYSNGADKYFIVIYYSRQQHKAVELLSKWIAELPVLEQKVKVYAFSPEPEIIAADFAEVADRIDAVPLPEAIYNAYRNTFRTLRLDKHQPKQEKEVDKTIVAKPAAVEEFFQ